MAGGTGHGHQPATITPTDMILSYIRRPSPLLHLLVLLCALEQKVCRQFLVLVAQQESLQNGVAGEPKLLELTLEQTQFDSRARQQQPPPHSNSRA